MANFLAFYSKNFTQEILFPSKNLLFGFAIFIFATSLLLASFGIVVLISESKKQYVFYYLLLISTLCINIFLTYQISGISDLILNSCLITLSLFVIQERYRSETKNQIKVSLTSISHNVGTFILLLAISISLNYFILNSSEDAGTNSFQMTKSYLISTSNAYIAKTVNSDFVREKLGQYTIDSSISGNIDESNNPLDQQQQDLTKQVQQQVADSINNWLDPYQNYFVSIATGIIFLTIISFMPIVRITTHIVALLLFALLKSIGVLKEQVETTEVIRYRI